MSVEAEAVRQYVGRLFHMLLPDDYAPARFRSNQMRLQKITGLWVSYGLRMRLPKRSVPLLRLPRKNTLFPSVAV